jgi:hypothetical protein
VKLASGTVICMVIDDATDVSPPPSLRCALAFEDGPEGALAAVTKCAEKVAEQIVAVAAKAAAATD